MFSIAPSLQIAIERKKDAQVTYFPSKKNLINRKLTTPIFPKVGSTHA